MAKVHASSVVFNAATQKYLVVLDNASLVRWDRDTTQITIECDKANLTMSSSSTPIIAGSSIPKFSPLISRNRSATFSGDASPSVASKSAPHTRKGTHISNISIIDSEHSAAHDAEAQDEMKDLDFSAFDQLAQKLTIKIRTSGKSTRSFILPSARTSQSERNSPTPKDTTSEIENGRIRSKQVPAKKKPRKNPAQDPVNRLSAYLLSIQNPEHKITRIKRLLRWTSMTERDVAMSLPSQYQDAYQRIQGNHHIATGLQGNICVVECVQTHNKYAMKSMRYRNVHELRRVLERYLIVFQHKFMEYKDIFIDTTSSNVHIIQPLLKQTITQKLRATKGRKFSMAQLKRVIFELVGKVDAIHGAGYVHHDLKPANIMFDEEAKLQIIDFDLMEKVGTKIVTKGSVGYIPPELFPPLLDKTGATKVCSASSMDIWSVGNIICYMAFKGRIPFHNMLDNEQRITDLRTYMNKHAFLNESEYRENKWSFLVDVKMDFGDDYDANLFRLISDLLSFQAEDRPTSAVLLNSAQYAWFNRQKKV